MKQAFCSVSIAPVRLEGKDQSEIVTQLLFGELVIVHEINIPWAKISTCADNYSGFVDHKHIVELTNDEANIHIASSSFLSQREKEISTDDGVQRVCRGAFYPIHEKEFRIGPVTYSQNSEEDNIFSILKLTKDYLNTPYLWGGKSPFGIDCSGLTQVIFSLNKIQLPRDASQQAKLGEEINFTQVKVGDLAFFENKKGQITHVGILDGRGFIYHASGWVRKDPFTQDGIIHSETNKLTHVLFCIKRVY